MDENETPTGPVGGGSGDQPSAPNRPGPGPDRKVPIVGPAPERPGPGPDRLIERGIDPGRPDSGERTDSGGG
jgi:hypothetical protein